MSNNLRQAAQAALEALGDLLDCPYDLDEATIPKAGIDAAPEQVVGTMCVALARMRALRTKVKELRAALAEPQPEPVAWMIKTGHGNGFRTEPPQEHMVPFWLPLYAAPRAKDQKQLTDKQILAALGIDGSDDWTFTVARAIERAHGIGKP